MTWTDWKKWKEWKEEARVLKAGADEEEEWTCEMKPKKHWLNAGEHGNGSLRISSWKEGVSVMKPLNFALNAAALGEGWTSGMKGREK